LSTSAEHLLLDTSTAIAYVSADNPLRPVVRRRVDGARLGMAGHAFVEFVAVTTRVAPPQRISGLQAVELLDHHFSESRFLSPERQPEIVRELVRRGILGGSLYDGLVGAAAREHGLTLLTADRRASATYDALGVRYELLRAA